MDKANLVITQPRLETLKKILRFTGILVAALLGLFITLNILLYIFQEKLIYFPQDISQSAFQQIHERHSNVQDLCLPMKDGTNLRGWLVGPAPEITSKLLIYFGGNGDELSQTIDDFKKYPDWSVVLINYRGYGQSEGNPNEELLFSDALEIYDYFSKGKDDELTIKVVMGRSLGTGVAVHLAKSRKVNGVILTSPYDSVLSVAQDKFPIIPVGYLLKNKFDSIDNAPSIKVPVFIFIATEDELIDPWHSQELAKKLGGTVQIQEIKGATHNSIVHRNEYWQGVSWFLDQF